MPKKHIQVAGNPEYKTSRRPNQPITNPANGTSDFGEFPGFRLRHIEFPPGPIQLKHGQHFGPHSGYGVEHICAEHFSRVSDKHEAITRAVALVAEILQTGATIHYEGGVGKYEKRSIVCRRAHGIVILELQQDSRNCAAYSVVTAIPKANPRGTKVGTI